MVEHVLTLNDVTKVFSTDDGPILAVDSVNFQLSGDDFFTMLGPSGCGKTTTLRMIAGLESVTSGSVSFDGHDFSRFSAFRRNIGMVFQSYALFPHMTLFENAAYGLRIRNLPERAVAQKVTEILDLLGLADLRNRYPADLSGGQQQRVSIARALVYDPGMLLLDEPLANLDAKLRVEMREEIRRIQKELGIMTLYVTHDQEEAMSVSDRLAVFNLGKLMQAGPPQEVYDDPVSLFVSDFIGKADFFPVHVNGRDAMSAKATLNCGHEVVTNKVYELMPDEEGEIPDGFDGTLMVRPEHIDISAAGSGDIPCTVQRVQHLGSFIRYIARCASASREIIVDSPRVSSGVEEGCEASITIRPSVARLFLKAGGG